MSKKDDIRVRRPEEYANLLNILKEKGIFSSFKNALVFAATLGYKQQIRLPFEKSSERIMLRIFDDSTDIPFITCLALAETKDASILKRSRFPEAIQIFEEYAHGGLSLISEYVKDDTNVLQSMELLVSSKIDASESMHDSLNPFG
ncbi:DNA phosphorothioation-associated protein 4 [Pseudidiomarina sp.]|uniref:DNA phosphorothioation-associated protein 4 n=1 Tax=Pseudidiomarina sp. TaxID=2081707 RepID=UPI003A978052